MDYNAPYGSADPNAGYVDRNTPGAVSGSRVPAAAVEMPQREIVTVIKNAGLTPVKTDPTQLDQAIDKKILAATGGGGDDNYVLMTQARVRLPIFPEVLTADGRLPVVSPSAGQVRVPAGYEFLHRGIFLVTTEQVDFVTSANKTYHLRWNPTDGFALKDVADVAYNSASLAETVVSFDSTYDDMLVARVVTNSSNVATITNLTNKDRLFSSTRQTGTPTSLGAGTLAYSATETVNWSRAAKLQAVSGSVQADMSPAASMDHIASWVDNIVITRYSATARVRTDWQTGATSPSSAAYLDFNLGA